MENSGLRWGVGQRFEFIEFRLFWEGHINRADIAETFGVSVNQASNDLNRYLEMAPGNMAYDKIARAYIRSPGFAPQFLDPDPGRYFSELCSIASEVERAPSWLGFHPSFAMIPAPVRGVNALTLRAVVAAIRRHEEMEMRYQSLSAEKPIWRWIAPHSLGFDGFRWHVRAYCPTSGAFKDFLVARMLETRGARPSEVSPADDDAWHSQVALEIGPHPALSPSQRVAVELDYGMRDGRVSISVRRALLYYALRRLGLDTAPSARRPQDQQIVLLNAGEVDPALAEVRE